MTVQRSHTPDLTSAGQRAVFHSLRALRTAAQKQAISMPIGATQIRVRQRLPMSALGTA